MIPMGKLTEVYNERKEFSSYLEILSQFVDAVAGKKVRYDVMKRSTAEASGCDDPEKYAETVLRYLPEPLGFQVQVTLLAPVKMYELFSEGFKTSPVFKYLMKFLAQAHEEGESGLLLFKVANNGVWAAHNINMSGSLPRLVIPASAISMINLQIMPLKTWEADYRTLTGDVL